VGDCLRLSLFVQAVFQCVRLRRERGIAARNHGAPILWRVVLSANYEVGVEVRVRIWEKFRRRVGRMKNP